MSDFAKSVKVIQGVLLAGRLGGRVSSDGTDSKCPIAWLFAKQGRFDRVRDRINFKTTI